MERVGRLLRKAEAKLDNLGWGAWLAAIVVGFVLVWPVGLALLFYMIWSGRMGCSARKTKWRRSARSTGNTAFDDYREQTLRRLDEEQQAFEGFLDRLRQAKDRAEFQQFQDEQKASAATAATPAT